MTQNKQQLFSFYEENGQLVISYVDEYRTAYYNKEEALELAGMIYEIAESLPETKSRCKLEDKSTNLVYKINIKAESNSILKNIVNKVKTYSELTNAGMKEDTNKTREIEAEKLADITSGKCGSIREKSIDWNSTIGKTIQSVKLTSLFSSETNYDGNTNILSSGSSQAETTLNFTDGTQIKL